MEADTSGYVGQFVVRRNLLKAGKEGIISFDYEKNTVRFGNSIGKSDAERILQEMKDRHFLTENQINPSKKL